LLLSLV